MQMGRPPTRRENTHGAEADDANGQVTNEERKAPAERRLSHVVQGANGQATNEEGEAPAEWRRPEGVCGSAAFVTMRSTETVAPEAAVPDTNACTPNANTPLGLQSH